MIEYILPALIGGVAGVLAAYLPLHLANKKLPSRRTVEAVAIVTAADLVLENLREEVVRLERKIEKLEAANAALEQRIQDLKGRP